MFANWEHGFYAQCFYLNWEHKIYVNVNVFVQSETNYYVLAWMCVWSWFHGE